MDWNILIAILLFIISITGILYVGNMLIDILEKIFDINPDNEQ
jgi:hypothetical protein